MGNRQASEICAAVALQEPLRGSMPVVLPVGEAPGGLTAATPRKEKPREVAARAVRN